VLTGNVRPGGDVLKLIQEMPFRFARARGLLSRRFDRSRFNSENPPNDTEKISLIRDLIAEYVD